MTSNTKMVRDALGSPVPQTLNEDDNTYTVLANGDVTGIDFSKYKLLRDALGSPLPYQYFDTVEGKFVEGTLNGGSVDLGDLPQRVTSLENNLDGLEQNFITANVQVNTRITTQEQRTNAVIRNDNTTALRTEVVSSLPTSNLNTGRIVFNTADNTFRGYNGGEWV